MSEDPRRSPVPGQVGERPPGGDNGGMSSSRYARACAPPSGSSYPMSLGGYDSYDKAQRAVDYLADHEFPVQNVLIVGTDLKQLERVTGGSRVAGPSAAAPSPARGWACSSGSCSRCSTPRTGSTARGPGDGRVRAAVRPRLGADGSRATPGPSDFTSVTQVVATKYEVLVERKSRRAAARCSPRWTRCGRRAGGAPGPRGRAGPGGPAAAAASAGLTSTRVRGRP